MRSGYIPILAFVLLSLTACESEPVVEPTPMPVSATRQEVQPVVWPPPAEDQALTLAEDLLAKNYMVVFDGSGSMGDKGCSGPSTKATVAKQAIVDFAQEVGADANLGLIVFARSAAPAVHVALGTTNRQQFTQAISAIQVDGGTPLRSAVTLARQKLEKQARKQQGYGEYHMVIVTDGEASSGQSPTQVVHKLLVETPIIVHTIGFCIGTRHSLNQPGRTVYKAANDSAGLRQGLEDVLAESPAFDVTDFYGPHS